MAEIEKGLPNEPDLKVEDVAVDTVVEDIKEEPKEVEVMETADGGAEISFDPNAVEPVSSSHNQNLAELLDRYNFRSTRFKVSGRLQRL